MRREDTSSSGYKDVADYFAAREIAAPNIALVREAVTAIRAAKLPDLTKWGTAGSFFKNPIISAEHFNRLKAQYPDMPSFPEPAGKVKIPLGWILDKVCKVKGLSIGGASIHEKQALVIVAKLGATSADVNSLADELGKTVKEKTGIDIEREVEYVI
jgi:UDP-N-acetylmuramate dehydrogenase